MKWPRIEVNTQIWEDADFLKSQMGRYLFIVFYSSLVLLLTGYLYFERLFIFGYIFIIVLTGFPLLSYRQYRRKVAERERELAETAEKTDEEQ